ncbi:hypothetical protein CgunFtcFv8_013940 [Champsocephalus gunnari]|uniref:Uncharacterized protein n=1 Tax=Champsocephalus gunnari TaxID=52237 RepID=A0AAN8E492_CHAGU|nr:hypothetical protein CgunFtcFv8_013940 [Champsocephalus gunnari]
MHTASRPCWMLGLTPTTCSIPGLSVAMTTGGSRHFSSVLNNDVPSAKLLLEAGAMANQDPIKWLQVSLRVGNYELINLLLRYGANVNYYCKVNTSHFPSALQYAFKDEVVLRMLCNYGYDVAHCFDCPYGNSSHIPDDYEGWTDNVIKDTMVTDFIITGGVWGMMNSLGH